MKIPQKKCCDLCGEIVAEKKGLFWSTEKDFITLRLKEKPHFTDDFDALCRSKMHICFPCFLELKRNIKKYTEVESNER